MVRGAYVATPAAEVELVIPNGWNPRWPFPGSYPPGFIPTDDPEIIFIDPPTPDELRVDEEITVQIQLRDAGIGNLPTPDPEDGSSDITWWAVLGGEVIWISTSSWSNIWGYAGQEITFTPPLTDDDVGETMTVWAQSVVILNDIPYLVSVEHDIEIKSKVPVAFEGYLIFDSWEVTGATLMKSWLKTVKSGTSNRDWPQVSHYDYTSPWGEEENWFSGTAYTQLPEVISTYQHVGEKRIDVSIPSLLTDGMYSLAWSIDPNGGFSGSVSCYAKVTYDDDSFDTWTKTLTVIAGGDSENLGLVIDRRYGGYVGPSGWD